MKVWDFRSASCRRVIVLLGVVAALAVAPSVHAQGAPVDQFTFKSAAGMIQWQVKGDKIADFEGAWVAIRTKLMASEKPELKALGDGLRMYKVDMAPVQVPQAGPIATYYFLIDPVSATLSYDPSKLLYDMELFPRPEADPIFNKLAESLAGIGPQPLKKLQ